MMDTKSDRTASRPEADRDAYPIKVWDLPTRLFHWVLVALVSISFVTVAMGGTAMSYHERCGVAILVVLVFRIIWGFVGGRESRFNAFMCGPRAVWRHATAMFQSNSQRQPGHNPMGAWSVVAMLLVLLIQAGTGLFANDDILTQGPLFDLVGKDTSNRLTGIHHLNHVLLMILIIIHICAIGFYHFYKKDNLTLAMLTGVKKWPAALPPTRGSSWLAAVIVAFVAALVYGMLYARG